jgi:hypothetical protein
LEEKNGDLWFKLLLFRKNDNIIGFR